MTDTIYNEDCLVTTGRMPNGYVDLIVTSPPYDNLRTYNGYSFNFEAIAKELYRVTKDGGVVVWVVGDATINGSETGTSFKQALFFKDCGFWLYDTMIWQKTGRIPTQDRYYNIFEYMFVFSKGKPGALNLIKDHPNTEAGRVQIKDSVINKGKNVKGTTTFTREALGIRGNIWKIPIGHNKTKHPAIFPKRLARDHILSWSNEGDIVYDPFMGSGTTALAARSLNRIYIGSETSSEYCDVAEQRLGQGVLL